MKIIKTLTIVVFSLIIIIPVVTFNFQPNASSAIDNRMLTENPFSQALYDGDYDLTENIENYINDRIGLRDEMILAYTVLNDTVFGKMVHPSYQYGTDGYVFGQGLSVSSDRCTTYHEAMADMIKRIQVFCEDRDIPFIFVFSPAKPAVLSDYVPEGINYDRTWVEDFFELLDEREIRYIDNTETLKEKTEQGEAVFNQKYDANHWNDLGAYYGTNAVLEELQKDFPLLEINDINEFSVTEKIETSLPVSQFPINELVPVITVDMSNIENKTDIYSGELVLDPSYKTFGSYENTEKLVAGAPKALVFQGSYMNNYGYKYFMNAFGEYNYIHDYQNITNFPYYYNIFKPDCVIFEMAEYTFSDIYFSYEGMIQLSLNPLISEIIESGANQKYETLTSDMLYIDSGETLTNIYWDTDSYCEYVWLSLGDEIYDMMVTETGFYVTVPAEVYNSSSEITLTVYDSVDLISFEYTDES